VLTHVDDLVLNVLNGVLDQDLDRLPASVGHQAAVQLLDPPQNLVHLELVDEGADGLQHELDVVDGMTLLHREDHLRRDLGLQQWESLIQYHFDYLDHFLILEDYKIL